MKIKMKTIVDLWSTLPDLVQCGNDFVAEKHFKKLNMITIHYTSNDSIKFVNLFNENDISKSFKIEIDLKDSLFSILRNSHTMVTTPLPKRFYKGSKFYKDLLSNTWNNGYVVTLGERDLIQELMGTLLRVLYTERNKVRRFNKARSIGYYETISENYSNLYFTV